MYKKIYTFGSLPTEHVSIVSATVEEFVVSVMNFDEKPSAVLM